MYKKILGLLLMSTNISGSYKINGVEVLSGTTLGSGVTTSSLTSLGTLSSLTVSGNVAIDSTTLKVDSANNRVGIVNGSPAYPLDVVGDCNLSTGSKYRINGVDALASLGVYDNYNRTTTLSVGLATPTLITFDQAVHVGTSLTYSAGTFTNASGKKLLVQIGVRGSSVSGMIHNANVEIAINGVVAVSIFSTTIDQSTTRSMNGGTVLLLNNNDNFAVYYYSRGGSCTVQTGFQIALTTTVVS